MQSQAVSQLSRPLILLQIKALIRKYIYKQETINLVVVPSNVDIATTEALSMAQEVDPDGDRTIGKKRKNTRVVGGLIVEMHPLNANGCILAHAQGGGPAPGT